MKTVIQKIINAVGFVLCLAALSIHAHANQSVIDDIESALNQGDSLRLEQISDAQSGYVKALAHYRYALLQKNKGKQSIFAEHLDHAIKVLKSNINTSNEILESKLLLAQVYGLKISVDSSLGVQLGEKSYALLQESRQLDQANPRAYLFSGIAKMYMPAIYGGGIDSALADFKLAIKYYPNDASSGYHWGFSEAYIWIGLAQVKQGDMEQAKASWKQALELNPESNWAKYLLGEQKVK